MVFVIEILNLIIYYPMKKEKKWKLLILMSPNLVIIIKMVNGLKRNLKWKCGNKINKKKKYISNFKI